MKNIIKVSLLFCAACFICACHESDTEKLQKMAAKIGHNKPLIIESLKRHKVNYETPYMKLKSEDFGKNIPIHEVEESLSNFKAGMNAICILKTLNESICDYNMIIDANSTDNNTWIVEVMVGSRGDKLKTTHSFKILKDKKHIMPMDENSCQVLDLNLTKLLKQKYQKEPVDWEKECSFPIKFVKGMK